MPSEASGFEAGVGVGVGVPVGVGVGVGVTLGVGVGTGVGVGVGVGELKALPSNDPGFVADGNVGVDVVAFELKAIHRPSLLITGRVLTIATRMLSKVVALVGSKSTLLVSVI